MLEPRATRGWDGIMHGRALEKGRTQMGQSRNSGRQAQLDEKKRRAAGRNQTQGPDREAIRDAYSELPARGRTAGAFGKEGRTNPRGGQTAVASGGGGGATLPSRRTPVDVPRSRRPARKRTS